MQAAIAQTVRGHRAEILGTLLVMLVVVGLSGITGAQAQSNADRAFLAWAIQIEIQQQDMGHIAERRARTAAVRNLGNYLIERHQLTQQRLQGVAKQMKVVLSDKLSATHLRVQSRFSSIPRASFDEAFVRHEVGDYRYFLAHFEAAANSGNVLIRQYATNEIARLREDQSKITALIGHAG